MATLATVPVRVVASWPMADAPWTSGRLIADRYRLEAPIGRGGMGEVWRAMHTRLHSHVAIKLLDNVFATQPEAVPRFLREAQAYAAIRGGNVVQVLDFGIEDGTPYIAMELLAGESLRERLERDKTLAPATTLRVVRHVAKAMGRAHKQGIVHRDLKPGNIYVCPDENGDGADASADDVVIKVLDFGIAKLVRGAPLEGEDLTRTGQVLGTAAYMSPEQCRGRMDVDHRTDLWALAIITYQCLIGALPFGTLTGINLLIAICGEPMPTPSQG